MEKRIRYDTSKDEGAAKVRPRPPVYVPEPIWQPFPGFSFLFDNPGKSLSVNNGYVKIEVDYGALNQRDLDLYTNIAKAVEIIDPTALAQLFQFFALPSSTYHVTVWDGVNKGNMKWLGDESKKVFEECFAAGVASVLRAWPPFKGAREYASWFRGTDPIRLYYNGLRARGTTVLVVELTPDPMDKASVQALADIRKRRAELDSYFTNYGKPENHSLIPHVAVGYFANSDLGRSAMFQQMDTWMAAFDEKLRGCYIEFQTIDLYAFVDMVTYFKPLPK